MRFFVGLHQPSDAQHFRRACISVNRLRKRTSAFKVGDWIMDSGAFSIILKHGGYPDPVEVYAAEIKRWSTNGRLLAAVTQDYMCEPAMLERTGLTVRDHQRLTIERYDRLRGLVSSVYIMPVLQGYAVYEYRRHLRMYGSRLAVGAWVGVGSVCKRNSDPTATLRILRAIHRERPDLRLHGFGLKTTALASPFIRQHLASADSMAWSFHERKHRTGRQNDWRMAKRFAEQQGS